nr:hypothetical protein [Tanacetum cinerariifolium]
MKAGSAVTLMMCLRNAFFLLLDAISRRRKHGWSLIAGRIPRRKDNISEAGHRNHDAMSYGHEKWPPKVTLGRLLPHARGLGFKPRRGGFPSGAKNEWGLSPKAKVRVLHTAQLDVTVNSNH